MILSGSVRVPGDKSLTHRALYLAALAPGRSRLEGVLTSLDARSTAAAVRRLGADVSPLRSGRVVEVRGGRWRRPEEEIHCGNSGTTVRLGMGLLAAHPFAVTLTGDRSLRRRPMRRAAEPLIAMGAQVVLPERDGLPLTIRGGSLRPLVWELPVSSAQLKGAILLAGMAGRVPVRVREPAGRSRDHTERMLRAFGFTVTDEPDGWIGFAPTGRLAPFETEIPGDISSAAFLLGAATLAEGGELRLENVGVNPTRTGMLTVLGRMGGRVAVEHLREFVGEPVADLVVWPSSLRATVVRPREIPGLIDEIPMLAVLASRAEGTTVFEEVGELRVKESDRLALIAANLRAVGVDAVAEGADLFVTGTARPPAGRVTTAGDHRIAMAFAVLGKVRGARVRVDDMACADVSFPGFVPMLRSIERPR
jgi:3-phosphoshikimate 1-carboxyvinyltransferase